MRIKRSKIEENKRWKSSLNPWIVPSEVVFIAGVLLAMLLLIVALSPLPIRASVGSRLPSGRSVLVLFAICIAFVSSMIALVGITSSSSSQVAIAYGITAPSAQAKLESAIGAADGEPMSIGYPYLERLPKGNVIDHFEVTATPRLSGGEDTAANSQVVDVSLTAVYVDGSQHEIAPSQR